MFVSTSFLFLRLPLLITLSFPPTSRADYATVPDNLCDCFLTNGINLAYYKNRQFFDFRSLSSQAGVPDPLNDPNATSAAPPTSDFFNSSAWTDFWDIQTWNNSDNTDPNNDASILMVNSANNLYIEANSDPDAQPATWLTLRTIRFPSFQSAAEIDSVQKKYQFLSVRMLARTLGNPGACTALFTYRAPTDDGNANDDDNSRSSSPASSSNQSVQEADVEVLTSDPTDRIQYTNQPSVDNSGDAIEAATRNATVPISWREWAVHRLDWIPKQSTWYVNGVQVASISFQAPRDASALLLNAWSDGGQWTGNMSVGDSAYLQVQWLDLLYNETSTGGDEATKRGIRKRSDLSDVAAAGAGRGDGVFSEGGTRYSALGKRDDDDMNRCRVVCSIDEATQAGLTVELWSMAPAQAVISECRRQVNAAPPNPIQNVVFDPLVKTISF